MSSPLDRIEADVPDELLEAIQRPHNFVPYSLYDEITKLAEKALGELIAERRALVNVAKAAEEAANPMTSDGRAAPFMWHPANERLREALAALNKEPA